MTNAEKFYEVFGTRGWVDWDAEYNGKPTIPLSAIEKIKAKIRHKQWYLGVNNANQIIGIIDDAIKEVNNNV